MKRVIKLKAYVKPKCDCENHYLELCQSFEEDTIVYHRLCCKCGKWWTFSETTKIKYGDREEVACYNILGEPMMTLWNIPKHVYKENVLICDDGRGRRDIYEVNRDGTLGKLIKSEKIQRW